MRLYSAADHFCSPLVRTILLALRQHFCTDDRSAIGYLDYSAAARADLAHKSRQWRCKQCGHIGTGSDGPIGPEGMNHASPPDPGAEPNLFIIGICLLALSMVFSYLYVRFV